MYKEKPIVESLPDPENWQVDGISRYLAASERNTRITFEHQTRLWRVLAILEDLFDKLSTNLDGTNYEANMLFVCRAYSTYIATIRLLVATQSIEVYPLLRSTLEYSIYALYFRDHLAELNILLKRHEGKKQREKAQKVARPGQMLKYITTIDKRAGQEARRLYETTIDLGAHPNPASIMAGYVLEGTLEAQVVTSLTFVGTSPPFYQAAESTLAIGFWSIRLCHLTFPDETKSLDIPNTLGVIDKEITDVIQSFPRV